MPPWRPVRVDLIASYAWCCTQEDKHDDAAEVCFEDYQERVDMRSHTLNLFLCTCVVSDDSSSEPVAAFLTSSFAYSPAWRHEALCDETICGSACVAERRGCDWIFSVFLSFVGQVMGSVCALG